MKTIPVIFMEIQSNFIPEDLTKIDYKHLDYQFKKKFFITYFSAQDGKIYHYPKLNNNLLSHIGVLQPTDKENGRKHELGPVVVNRWFKNSFYLHTCFNLHSIFENVE